MDSQNETTHVLIASCWFYFETFVITFKRGNNGCPEGGRKVIMVSDFACGSSKCEDC
jgi:hypothetical protein